ncbi:hypothetical protein T06_17057 [Trichinella sp. T6]|nr:hypothetical protein T06_17057 [Trichinella sp. T6]
MTNKAKAESKSNILGIQTYQWYTIDSQVLLNTDSHNWRNSILLVD